MSHRKQRRIGGGGGGHEEGGHGGDKPWVYFMVDCFFLITEFFMLTFKVKVEESVLPQRLPPGGTAAPTTKVVSTPKENLMIHVTRAGGTPVYTFMQRQASGPELYETLARAAASGGDKYSVRVSYEADVPWGDVMTVFNACNKVKIAECGLIPLRGRDR